MHKQDRQASRTPAALERKYGFGRRFLDQDQANRDQDTQTAAVARMLDTHIRSADRSLSRLSQEQAKLEAGLSALEQRHRGFQEDMDRSLRVIQDTVGAMLTALTALQEKTASLSAAGAARDRQLALLQTQFAIQESRIDQLDAVLEDLGDL